MIDIDKGIRLIDNRLRLEICRADLTAINGTTDYYFPFASIRWPRNDDGEFLYSMINIQSTDTLYHGHMTHLSLNTFQKAGCDWSHVLVARGVIDLVLIFGSVSLRQGRLGNRSKTRLTESFPIVILDIDL